MIDKVTLDPLHKPNHSKCDTTLVEPDENFLLLTIFNCPDTCGKTNKNIYMNIHFIK